MAPKQPAHDAFVAAIEAKIAAWKAVLDSYRAAVSLDRQLGDVATHQNESRHTHDGGKAIDLPVGIFRDKSIKEAIEIYLGAGRRKQTNKEIALGLQKGGIATTSTNFEATVATALGRMKDDGTVLRFPDGWDLAASYPDSLRSRLDKDTKPKRRKRPSRKADRSSSSTTADDGGDKTAKILDYISNGISGRSIADVVSQFHAAGVPCSRDYVRVVAKRLRKRGLIDIRDGKFYAKTA